MSLVLGKEIAEIRKKRNMTQKKLCSGICSQGTISLIEKGEVTPGIDIMTALAVRLNVPITDFISLIQSEHTYLKYGLLNRIENYMESHKYEKIYKMAQSEINKLDNPVWLSYYFNWLYFLSGYYTNQISLEVSLHNIKELYNSAPEYELNKDHLADRILNSIAILYAFNKDFKSALFYFKKINIEFKARVEIFDYNKIQLRILYNKVKTLYDMKLFEETIGASQLGIEQAIKTESMGLIGNFYYYLASTYEQLEYPYADISLNYRRALHFFEVLDKKVYIDIIKSVKSGYLEKDC